jgi:hypothetical protein
VFIQILLRHLAATVDTGKISICTPSLYIKIRRLTGFQVGYNPKSNVPASQRPSVPSHSPPASRN